MTWSQPCLAIRWMLVTLVMRVRASDTWEPTLIRDEHRHDDAGASLRSSRVPQMAVANS